MQDLWQQTEVLVKQNNIPIEMVLELSRRCNLACCHCYNIKDEAQLSLEQARDILMQLRRAGCLFLVFTGGEVFLHPDFLEIAALSRALGFAIKIFTNGTLITSAIAKKLAELHPLEVGVTLPGATSGTCQRITGCAVPERH